jgi:hypothetical protein
MQKVVIVLLLVIISGWLVGCGEPKPDLLRGGAAKPTETTDKAKIEAYARIKLPANATEIQASVLDGFQDDAILLKFKLPANDLEAFLQSAGYKEPLEDNFSPIGLQNSKELKWWTPGAAKVFAGAEVVEPGFAKKIMVDKSDPKVFIVYLSHFQL